MKESVFKNICWVNWLYFIIVFCLFVVSLLSACGTKGDLYLPDKETKTSTVQNIK
ncbi:MAG: lipoprotein [Cocleimonas sp.]|nr:lipoprotein [Cocleimonas sp.]